jgi:hypothetical protein
MGWKGETRWQEKGKQKMTRCFEDFHLACDLEMEWMASDAPKVADMTAM